MRRRRGLSWPPISSIEQRAPCALGDAVAFDAVEPERRRFQRDLAKLDEFVDDGVAVHKHILCGRGYRCIVRRAPRSCSPSMRTIMVARCAAVHAMR